MKTRIRLNTIEAKLYGLQVILTHIDSTATDRIEIRSCIHRTDRADQYFKHPSQQTLSEIEIIALQPTTGKQALLYRKEHQAHDLPVWGQVQDLHYQITKDPNRIDEIVKLFAVQNPRVTLTQQE